MAAVSPTVNVVDQKLFDYVVKIECVKSVPNYYMPWKMTSPYQSWSTGFIIDSNRILCTAHGVTYAQSLLVTKHGNPKKYNASITHLCNDVDLALLDVDDPEFWQSQQTQKTQITQNSDHSNNPNNDNNNNNCLEFDDKVPLLQDTINVLGYPLGGTNICITKGVVSRVSHSDYSHSGLSNLVIQVDAAINGGVSGGPGFINNKVVGMAFQGITNAQNVGYCIPVSVIQWFLNGIEKFSNKNNNNTSKNVVPRVVSLGIWVQKCENNAMQRKLRMIKNNNNNNIAITNETQSQESKMTGLDKIDYEIDPKSVKNLENTEKNGEKMQITKEIDAKIAAKTLSSEETTDATNHDNSNNSKNESKTDGNSSDIIEFKSDLSENNSNNLSNTINSINNKIENIANEVTGVYIRRVFPASCCHDILQTGDILLSINDIPIANDGTVSFRYNERINFQWIIRQLYDNDKVLLKILRNGEIMTVKLDHLSIAKEQILIKYHCYDIAPKNTTYFIFGGLVFVPLSAFFLSSAYGSSWSVKAPTELLEKYYYGIKRFENEEVVILAHILPNRINHGYRDTLNRYCIIKKCNDIEIKNTRHLASIIDNLDANSNDSNNNLFVTLEVSPYNVCIIEVSEARRELNFILKDNRISCDRSDDLKNI